MHAQALQAPVTRFPKRPDAASRLSAISGRLPADLEKVAWSLKEAEVSNPVLVAGGAVLFCVTDVIEGSKAELDGVRELVRRRLMEESLRKEISRRTAHSTPPEAGVVLNDESVVAELDSGDSERVILNVSGAPLTVGEFRKAAGLKDSASVSGQSRTQRTLDAYHRNLENQLLVRDLLDSSAAEDEEIRLRAEEGLKETGIARLVDLRLKAGVEKLLDERKDELRSYYRNHKARYQSEPSFSLEIWDLPFDEHPPAQLRSMEDLRTKLAAGQLELQAAVSSLGGKISTPGWKDYAELDFLPKKAYSFLLQVPEDGYSIPYQQDQALHLIHVLESRAPHVLDYEKVKEMVRRDYLKRFGQQLTSDVINRELEEKHFVFFKEDLLSQLTTGSAP